MKNFFYATWRRRFLKNRKSVLRSRSKDGFTLTEILVSLIIAGIVVSGLLFLVVELLRIDRREIALEQVQRDMQRAMDYIADDLKEAVYVYADPTYVTTQLEDLSAEIAANPGTIPILAFWRVDEIDIADETSLPADCDGLPECELIKTRGAQYTLVVYYQRPGEVGGIWADESTTLKRYQLTRYRDLDAPGPAKYELTPGYLDPVESERTNFEDWVTSDDDTVGNSDVLVDYVNAAAPGGTPIDCRNLLFESNSPLTGEPDVAAAEYNYVLTPAGATRPTGFFACIRDPENTGGLRANQDLYLFLQGDADSASQFLQPAGENSRLPILQSQIKLGGVVDRNAN